MSTHGTPSKSRGQVALVLFIVFSPFLAAYGLIRLVMFVFRLPRRLRALAAVNAATLHCPNGHPNPTQGRFACGSCHGEYHGWVGACALCGTPAGWVPCDICGIAIALPWERL